MEPALRLATVRALALALVLSLPCGGLLGLLTGLVAFPCALAERYLERFSEERARAALLGLVGLWLLAFLGCAAAYLEVIYLRSVLEQGSVAKAALAVQTTLNAELIEQSNGPGVIFFCLSASLGFALATSLRVRGDFVPPLTLAVCAGVVGALLLHRGDLHGVAGWAGGILFLVPCLFAGALPLCVGLSLLYAGVDRFLPSERTPRWIAPLVD